MRDGLHASTQFSREAAPSHRAGALNQTCPSLLVTPDMRLTCVRVVGVDAEPADHAVRHRFCGSGANSKVGSV